MCQRVTRGERGEGERGANGLLKPSSVAQGADESVVGLVMCWIGRDGRSKGLCRLSGGAGGEQVKPALRERFGIGRVVLGHGSS